MIKRNLEKKLLSLSQQYPVVLITGPRQSGKTTIARKVFPDKPYVSLEDLENRDFANSDPKGFLAKYKNGAIFDEIQRAPDLPSYIQGIVDSAKKNGLYILTGSQNFNVIDTVNQSLAGRTAMTKLLPFSIDEIKNKIKHYSLEQLILTGFYPRIYDQKLNPYQAMNFYFENYVERDIRSLLQIKDLLLFEKFVKLCAGRIGQILNLSSLGNEVGISHMTARNWISLLEASYIIFLLPTYHENFNKRITKSPKLYFYDTGLASFLLGIENEMQMQRDPLRGNLFENLVVIDVLKQKFEQVKPANLFFYRDSNQNEVDLIIPQGQDLMGVEIKSAQTINTSFFKGLKNFEKNIKNRTFLKNIIYSGSDEYERENTKITSYKNCKQVLKKE